MDDNLVQIFQFLLAIGFFGFLLNLLNSRYNDYLHLKRDHSLSFLGEPIESWLRNIDTFNPVGASYSSEVGEVVPIEGTDIEKISMFIFLKEHMVSGYWNTWALWNRYVSSVREYNVEKAKVLNSLCNWFTRQALGLRLSPYYHQPGRSTPERYLSPFRMATLIEKELEHRREGWDKWITGEPILSETHYSDGKISYHITLDSYAIKDYDKGAIQSSIQFLYELTEDETTITKIQELRNIHEKSEELKQQFLSEIDIIKAQIEHKKEIRGRCINCPRFLWIFHP